MCVWGLSSFHLQIIAETLLPEQVLCTQAQLVLGWGSQMGVTLPGPKAQGQRGLLKPWPGSLFPQACFSFSPFIIFIEQGFLSHLEETANNYDVMCYVK